MQHPTARTAHEGPVFRVEVLEYEDPERGPVRKDIVRHPGAVLVIPIEDDGRLVMIRNRRVSVKRWLIEFCAGKIERGESPLESARRELAEECGRHAGRLVEVGRFLTSPGMSDELMHVFEARDLSPTDQRLEPGEDIEVQVMSVDQIESMIREGTIDDGKSIAALSQWKLRAKCPAGDSER